MHLDSQNFWEEELLLLYLIQTMDKKYQKQIKKYEDEILQFGENVKALRTRKNWTQLELATNSSLGLRTIQRIENGQITIKMPIIFMLAETFAVPVTTLFKNI